MKKKTFPMRLELSPSAKSILARLSDRDGVTELVMMSRLVEWFIQQDEQTQSAVVGLFPAELRGEVARLILNRMTNPRRT